MQMRRLSRWLCTLRPQHSPVFVVNTPDVAGYKVVEVKGVAHGSSVRSRFVGVDMLAHLRSLLGGEITSYTHLLEESREQALSRVQESARKMGANCVLNLRIATNSVTGTTTSEVYAYGTAAVIVPNNKRF